MVSRRMPFDALEPSSEARWLVVRNMHGAVLQWRALSPGADLKRLFIQSMADWSDAGWVIAQFSSSSGNFFCSRGTERCQITIECHDPRASRPMAQRPTAP